MEERLSVILSCIIGQDLGVLHLVYWFYFPSFGNVWSELTAARQEFGESLHCSSEPDLIAFSDKAVLCSKQLPYPRVKRPPGRRRGRSV